MSKKVGMLLSSLMAGILSAALAGLLGTIWGVTRYDPLPPAIYGNAFLSGAFLGSIPALAIAGLNVLFCYGAPSRFAQYFVPIMTAVLTFALVYFLSVLADGWTGCN